MEILGNSRTCERELYPITRFCVRVLATPFFVLAFGLCWIGFLLIIGPMFQAFSFLENERFSWRAHLADCNDFFCEPLVRMWGNGARLGS